MAKENSDNPNPSCPACGSPSVLELVYDAETEPEQKRSNGWQLLQGSCDVRPDRWQCSDCDFSWYPRALVEQDLDLLTWQIAQPEQEIPIDLLKERLSSLRKMISTLANPVAGN